MSCCKNHFAKEVRLTVENKTGGTVCDKICRYTLRELGIAPTDLKEDLSDIRFCLAEKTLSHYEADGIFYVRIPEIPAESAVEVTVRCGNPDAVNISDGDRTLEIEYGRRDVIPGPKRVIVTEAPNGDLLSMAIVPNDKGEYVFGIDRSTDGGKTWEFNRFCDEFKFPHDIPDWIKDSTGYVHKERFINISYSAGFITDKKNGVIICAVIVAMQHWLKKLKPDGDVWLNEKGESEDDTEGSDLASTVCFYRSVDNGCTWNKIGGVPAGAKNYPYAVVYANGIVADTMNAEDPDAIDYVLPMAVLENVHGGNFSVTAMYSKDQGVTWHYADNLISGTEFQADNVEGGSSEPTVMKFGKNRLMIYARNQGRTTEHFVVSFSEDNGKSWSESVLSRIFTPNTNPILERVNGTPIVVWGGNNTLGGDSYLRFPLSAAVLDDDGIGVKRVLDLSYNMPEELAYYKPYKVTNPGVIVYEYEGKTCLFAETGSCMVKLRIEDVDEYLMKTKGAFDSFENGTEGWIAYIGGISTGEVGATDGEKALHIAAGTVASRSVPSIRRGMISMDLYIEEIGEGVTLDFATAYNTQPGKTAPIALRIASDGRVFDGETDTGLKLNVGANKLAVNFNGPEAYAELTVNGKTAKVVYDAADADDYVAFVILRTAKENSAGDLVRFTAIDED